MIRFVTVGILGCCIAATPAFAADVKLGYIDMQRALVTSEAGKEAKEQLTARVKKYQDEINIKQENIKKLKEELEKQGTLLSESARLDKREGLPATPQGISEIYQGCTGRTAGQGCGVDP